MAIVSEDGTGVPGAEMYGTIAAIDAYWAARPQNALAAEWAAATTPNKEGAAREAAAYLDGFYGPFYIGQRVGYVQGLEWPRNAGLGADGVVITLTDVNAIELPALPKPLLQAQAELSARALSARLVGDTSSGERVKSEKVGPISTEYFDGGGVPFTSFGIVAGLMKAITSGEPGTNASWFWR